MTLRLFLSNYPRGVVTSLMTCKEEVIIIDKIESEYGNR